jgi:hypothetical protein
MPAAGALAAAAPRACHGQSAAGASVTVGDGSFTLTQAQPERPSQACGQ